MLDLDVVPIQNDGLFEDVQFEGFKNLGNTCYVNAVLQAVLALSRFEDDLLSPYWQSLLDESNGGDSTTHPSCFMELTKVPQAHELILVLHNVKVDIRFGHVFSWQNYFKQKTTEY